MTTITVNNQAVNVDADAATPLLWVLRDHLGMTGTKFGCGMALCGACTVHIDGVATRSCVLPLSAVAGRSSTTIEGLSTDRSHAVQRAWIEIDVPQCGYCQSGQIMAAAALLKKNTHPTDAQIDDGMALNICRCGTYEKIRAGVHRAAPPDGLRQESPPRRWAGATPDGSSRARSSGRPPAPARTRA